jgi:beta-galactosidase/beta-glucuronidase
MREYINFNLDWKFTRKDDEKAWQKRYDDGGWRDVTLPHDWAVEEPFDPGNSSGTGYLAAGKGWYRKRFYLSEEAEAKLVYITFDGVYNNSQVWCNGYYLGKRPYGYSTFTYDISEFIQTGGTENVIAVMANHEHIADSRWYTGSGIYRKVTLTVKDKICFDNNGVFMTIESADEKEALIKIQAAITNHSDKDEQVQVVRTQKDKR